MAVLLSPNAKQQFTDNAGALAAGFKLYTYGAGTTTPAVTFSDRHGAVPNTNPIILDARGEATIYLNVGTVYDYVLKTADDVTVWTRPGVSNNLGDTNVSPFDFGAVADGSTDDTAALSDAFAEAIASGRTIDLGDDSRAYRVTAKIEHTVGSSGLRIRSSGATITYDPASPTREVMLLLTDVNSVEISGKLTIDANDKARIGLLVQNTGLRGGTVTLSDVAVRNVYRGDLAFTGGDGIMVQGGYDRVAIIRPDIRNCRMEVGAGVGGSQGIFGITVSRAGAGAPTYTVIEDCYIDGVFSEDPSYIVDQDAIRIFGDAPGTVASLNFFEVRGGYIAGHHGRGIKGQFNFGRVSGVKFHRYRGYTGGVCGREIDFQYGGGTIRDIECLYENNYVPETIAQLADPDVAGIITPSVTVDGVKVIIDGTTPIPYAFTQAKDQDEVSYLTISNVDIRGPINRFVQWWVRGFACALTMENIRAAPIIARANTRTTAAGTITESRIYARNCINTGGSTVDFLQRQDPSFNRCEISANDCYGFTDTQSHSGTGAYGAPFMRTHGIAAANARDSGIFRPLSNMGLADGAEWLLPTTAQAGQSCIIIVTVGSSVVGDQAIFAMSGAGAEKVTASGASWTPGGTSDPGSGDWRIWTSPSGIVIKNASGAARRVMAYIFG